MKFVLPLLLCLLAGCHRAPPAPQGPVYDVPTILGKSPDEIKQQIGATRGVKLTAEFSASGLLASLVLEADTPRDEVHRDEILRLGNLRQGDARYKLNFVEAPGQPGKFSAVRVVLPTAHEVKFIVTGAEELVSVTSGIAASGATILTIPPWHATQKFNIGQSVSLSAQYLVKEGQPMPTTPLKVEIFVDGRVLKEASGSGVVRCELTL